MRDQNSVDEILKALPSRDFMAQRFTQVLMDAIMGAFEQHTDIIVGKGSFEIHWDCSKKWLEVKNAKMEEGSCSID